jgi:proteasome lid subunit RPN8/RPN11
MDENAEVGQLIPAIITSLRLPITDDAGRPITYHLSHDNRRLEESETLASAEVQSGDTLVIVPEMTAGSQFDMTAQNEPLVVFEPEAHARQPVSGFPADYQVTLQTNSVQVLFKPDALHQVWVQAKKYPRQEVGGLLVGMVYEEQGRFLVNIEKIIEAEHTLAGLTFVTFTDKAWLDMLEQRNSDPTMFVIGWYHSHPGFGIFLSMSDEFIHRSFFGDQPWYLALVVDPVSDEWGIFTWEQGEIKRCFER